jgi:hypothetical protein
MRTHPAQMLLLSLREPNSHAPPLPPSITFVVGFAGRVALSDRIVGPTKTKKNKRKKEKKKKTENQTAETWSTT